MRISASQRIYGKSNSTSKIKTSAEKDGTRQKSACSSRADFARKHFRKGDMVTRREQHPSACPTRKSCSSRAHGKRRREGHQLHAIVTLRGAHGNSVGVRTMILSWREFNERYRWETTPSHCSHSSRRTTRPRDGESQPHRPSWPSNTLRPALLYPR